jgi:predicted permease
MLPMFDLTFLIIANIIPLYILVALGFISGKYLDVNLHSLAIVAIYILTPIVNFGALAQMEFTPEYLALPVITFCMSITIGTVSYKIAHRLWKNTTANLVGMASMNGNTMYFGLPVILAVLGPEWVGVYALMNLGTFINEIGIGYFFGARGDASVKGAIMKVLKMPVIPAIALGFLYNIAGFELPEAGVRYWEYARGAWVFIGMMIIGVALSKQSKLELDMKLIVNLFTVKFLVWPAVALAFVLVDYHVLGMFTTSVHLMIMIGTSVPLAGNLVAYSATLKLHPERAAAVVLASTVFALFTVPAAVLLYQMLVSGG